MEVVMENDRSEPRRKPGPEPERLKIEGDWKDALRQIVRKDQPPEDEPQAADKGEEGDDAMDDDT